MVTGGDNRLRVAIIGAGAAGLMAAGSILHCAVTVLERNEKPGKKLYITGKGRCNVTNDCAPEEFLTHVVSNPKFLYSSVYGFTPDDLREVLHAAGVLTKTERGNRVFPKSDKASDVIRALTVRAEKAGATFCYNRRVNKIERRGDGFCLYTDDGTVLCDKLLIATGGKSYPATGSTGDGYTFAAQLGHTIVPPRPTLVALKTKQDVSALAGLTLKNVSVRIQSGKHTFTQFGELLFTHTGVSGPTILRLSTYVNRLPMPMQLSIDLKPALDEETLDKRLTGDLSESGGKQLKNSLDRLLPKAVIAPIVTQSGVSADKKANAVTKEERSRLVHAVKNLCYEIVATDPFESAVATAGGVATDEIYPKTMESKKVKNLYFAGEVIDVDALTGGFNLQIAFSTAVAAARAIDKTQTEEKTI